MKFIRAIVQGSLVPLGDTVLPYERSVAIFAWYFCGSVPAPLPVGS